MKIIILFNFFFYQCAKTSDRAVCAVVLRQPLHPRPGVV